MSITSKGMRNFVPINGMINFYGLSYGRISIKKSIEKT